jgi:hypothetical protein
LGRGKISGNVKYGTEEEKKREHENTKKRKEKGKLK